MLSINEGKGDDFNDPKDLTIHIMCKMHDEGRWRSRRSANKTSWHMPSPSYKSNQIIQKPDTTQHHPMWSIYGRNTLYWSCTPAWNATLKGLSSPYKTTQVNSQEGLGRAHCGRRLRDGRRCCIRHIRHQILWGDEVGGDPSFTGHLGSIPQSIVIWIHIPMEGRRMPWAHTHAHPCMR